MLNKTRWVQKFVLVLLIIGAAYAQVVIVDAHYSHILQNNSAIVYLHSLQTRRCPTENQNAPSGKWKVTFKASYKKH